MNSKLQKFIFIWIFLSIYTVMHIYSFLRVSEVLSIERTVMFYSLLFFLAFSYFLAAYLEKKYYNDFTRSFYTFSATWMGVIFIGFFMLAVFEIFKGAFVDEKGFLISLLVLTGIISLYAILNARNIRIKKLDIPMNGLKKKVKAVQLSDIHIGTNRNSNYLNKIVEMTNLLEPDIVFLTGDLVDGSAPLHKDMFDPLKELEAPCYYIIGNHELYEGVDNVLDILEDTGIEILRNQSRKYKGLQIIGLDHSEKRNYVKDQLRNIKVKSPSVLLFHPPYGTNHARDVGVDLMLSGHTHNGQIFPFSLLVELFYNDITGLHRKGGMHLYISPGTGTWGPYMRLGSRNEITVLNLKPRSS